MPPSFSVPSAPKQWKSILQRRTGLTALDLSRAVRVAKLHAEELRPPLSELRAAGIIGLIQTARRRPMPWSAGSVECWCRRLSLGVKVGCRILRSNAFHRHRHCGRVDYRQIEKHRSRIEIACAAFRGRACADPLSGWRRARGLRLGLDRYGHITLCGRKRSGCDGGRRSPFRRRLGVRRVRSSLVLSSDEIWVIALRSRPESSTNFGGCGFPASDNG